jgi:hypothetical protein
MLHVVGQNFDVIETVGSCAGFRDLATPQSLDKA